MIHEKAQQLRKTIVEKGMAVGVGAGTPLEAKLIERAGFDFVWSSSLAVSAFHGIPDASLLSMSQYLEAARSMVEVIGIPVVADCDTGYGNANNVIYATQLFEAAGVAAMSMEDKKFPKDNSLLAGGRQELLSIEEFSGKICAAKDHQRSTDFAVIARIEALIAGWGLEEAFRRAEAYAQAGADFILIHSKSRTPDEVLAFIEQWDGRVPLVLVPTTYPTLNVQKVRELGKVKLMIYANHPLRAAVKGIEDALLEIQQSGGIQTVDAQLVPVTHIFELQGVPEMKDKEKRYLPAVGKPA